MLMSHAEHLVRMHDMIATVSFTIIVKLSKAQYTYYVQYTAERWPPEEVTSDCHLLDIVQHDAF